MAARSGAAALLALAAFAALPASVSAETSPAPTCPAPLANATRLVLVTADTMKTTAARLQTFERDKPGGPWRALGAAEPANIGRAGMAWSYAFRRFASRGEPVKVEGDKRTPAGVYAAGRSFGTLPSLRPGYLHVSSDTVCVDDVSSAAYNTIVSRRSIGPKVRVENMGRILPLYRRGIVVDYPTNASVRGGSCIFIHVWRTPATGTSGCVALPEARVEALQDFTDAGAAIAILPRHALDRMRGCLPDEAAPRMSVRPPAS